MSSKLVGPVPGSAVGQPGRTRILSPPVQPATLGVLLCMDFPLSSDAPGPGLGVRGPETAARAPLSSAWARLCVGPFRSSEGRMGGELAPSPAPTFRTRKQPQQAAGSGVPETSEPCCGDGLLLGCRWGWLTPAPCSRAAELRCSTCRPPPTCCILGPGPSRTLGPRPPVCAPTAPAGVPPLPRGRLPREHRVPESRKRSPPALEGGRAVLLRVSRRGPHAVCSPAWPPDLSACGRIPRLSRGLSWRDAGHWIRVHPPLRWPRLALVAPAHIKSPLSASKGRCVGPWAQEVRVACAPSQGQRGSVPTWV